MFKNLGQEDGKNMLISFIRTTTFIERKMKEYTIIYTCLNKV